MGLEDFYWTRERDTLPPLDPCHRSLHEGWPGSRICRVGSIVPDIQELESRCRPATRGQRHVRFPAGSPPLF